MSEKSRDALIFADTDSGGIIHIANIKGGVGKSTVATNLASALSRRGPTLVIDLDVQGSATVALGHDTSDVTKSSWELYRRRFSLPLIPECRNDTLPGRARDWLVEKESRLLGQVVGHGTLTSLAIKVRPSLDLIPANTDLFKTPTRFHLQNLVYNLRLAREYYKYIVLDTPSIWDAQIRALYLNSDLNLIPVTLNALSTKSLRDYLSNVRSLAEHNPGVRIRIVKNEVFGSRDSKIKGKARTMSENRKYLENLCEQVAFRGGSGVSLLPQSIMFDLEIPESATVRDAQDEGRPVHEYHQYSAAARAFDELARRVQYVLNTPLLAAERLGRGEQWIPATARALAAVLLLMLFRANTPVTQHAAPRPLAPQQLVVPSSGVVRHTFTRGESIYKLAKWAICHFRAKVPSMREVNDYVHEIVAIHNMTRLEGEPKIAHVGAIPEGLTVSIYPPAAVSNPQEKQLVPVYKFFMDLVQDQFAYVTGDWCERGTGGGQPHYGMDIAGKYGAKVITPIDGEIVTKTNETVGRTVGVVKDGTVIFFSHLDRRYFRDGAKVKAGQAIGTIGMTGRTSGPHVHIGYGVKTQTFGDISFGRMRFRVTDPKLFFYRHFYLEGIDKVAKKRG